MDPAAGMEDVARVGQVGTDRGVDTDPAVWVAPVGPVDRGVVAAGAVRVAPAPEDLCISAVLPCRLPDLVVPTGAAAGIGLTHGVAAVVASCLFSALQH